MKPVAAADNFIQVIDGFGFSTLGDQRARLPAALINSFASVQSAPLRQMIAQK